MVLTVSPNDSLHGHPEPEDQCENTEEKTSSSKDRDGLKPSLSASHASFAVLNLYPTPAAEAEPKTPGYLYLSDRPSNLDS